MHPDLIDSPLDPLHTNLFLTTWCHSWIARQKHRRAVAHEEAVAEQLARGAKYADVAGITSTPGAIDSQSYSPQNALSHTTLGPAWKDITATLHCMSVTRRRRIALHTVAVQKSKQLREEAERLHQLHLV